MDERTVLILSLQNLWKTYRYTSDYINFLLGVISEDDFHRIAESFADEFSVLTKEEISEASKMLTPILGTPIFGVDLALLLNIDPCSTSHGTD